MSVDRDGREEPITPPMHRLHVGRLLGIVPQRSADDLDGFAERLLGDGQALPARVEKLALRDDLPMTFEKTTQDGNRPGR